ncbi:MAG: fluoride efflux transporter CrcB [Planctomycetes bacterium]|nr:fluoride efflux transporter CrcB [Planctomycetota bacterium]
MTEPKTLHQLLAIAIGGGAGAICRHLVNLACSRWLGSHVAVGTLAVNVVGCFLIGLLIALRTTDSPRWDDLTHTALTIGFLGAFTTFSTFGFETTRFFENAQHSLGLLNIAGNMLLGLTAVFGGLQLGRLMVG